MNIFKRIFGKKQNPNDIITIKTSWDEITVQEMMDISLVLEDEDTEYNKIQTLVSILTGRDFEYLGKLPMVTYKMLMQCVGFLQTKPEPNKLKKSYTINGHKYKQCADVTKVTTAQFVDYNNYVNSGEKDITKILSVMLIPEGHEYGQGYDIASVQEDIKDMKYKDAMAISFFFAETIRGICDAYGRLFRETDGEEQSDGGTDDEVQSSTTGFEKYGIIPFILRVCELTNTRFEEVMQWQVCQTLFITCYAIDQQKLQEKAQKKWKKTH